MAPSGFVAPRVFAETFSPRAVRAKLVTEALAPGDDRTGDALRHPPPVLGSLALSLLTAPPGACHWT